MSAQTGTSTDPHETPGPDRLQLLLQFASSAAHEVVGPIDQVSSLISLFLRRYGGQLDDDADTLLSHIETARLRLGASAAGLRKCFQVLSAECDHIPVDVNAVIEQAIESHAKQIAATTADLRVGSLPAVMGDRELLVLLFQAVLDNTLKFRRTDVQPVVTVSAVTSSGNIVFQVTDNGIGVDPKYEHVVFDAFKKLHGHSYPGAGLGLTICRVIVKLHGGRIWLEAVPAGTRVCFELPAASPTAA